MMTIPDLEELPGIVRFPEVVRQADQAATGIGESVRRLARIELVALDEVRSRCRPRRWRSPRAVRWRGSVASLRRHSGANP
jgi:hypothetical protein